MLDADFIELLSNIAPLTSIPISDLLHLLKSARSHILNHLMMIDPDTFRCLNMSLFEEAAELPQVFQDRTTSGAMKDAYVLALYSWTTLIKVLQHGRFDAAFYIFPFILCLEAIKYTLLSKEIRIQYLATAVKFFTFHYRSIKSVNKDCLFQTTFRTTAIGVLFGDECFIARCINTCVGIAVAIFQNYLCNE